MTGQGAPMAPQPAGPCRSCGTWPEPRYVLEGDDGRGRTVRVSLPASTLPDDIGQELDIARTEYPGLKTWKAIRMEPAVLPEVMPEFETPAGGES